MKEIIVTLEKGNVVIETKGFKGKACKDATAALEKALGMVTTDAPTKEMYEKPVENTLKTGGGR